MHDDQLKAQLVTTVLTTIFLNEKIASPGEAKLNRSLYKAKVNIFVQKNRLF